MDQAKWIASKKLVNERDGGLCVRCGSEATDIHHRTPRGMGGTSDPETNYSPANLVSLCRSCHDWVHAHPAESYDSGLLLHSWETPARQPVCLANDTLLLYFGNDGTVRKVQQQALFLFENIYRNNFRSAILEEVTGRAQVILSGTRLPGPLGEEMHARLLV